MRTKIWGVGALALGLVTAGSSASAAPRPVADVDPPAAVKPVPTAPHRWPLMKMEPEPPAPPPPAWICPVAGSYFVDSFGDRRSGGRRHQGVDMLAGYGTPVLAPVGGTVTYRSNSLGGQSFYLLGDDGTYYYGTHLSGYGVEGRVEAGTVIGYVGDSGNAKGTPHLHFEIHPGGESAPAVDPYPVVAQYCPPAPPT